MNRPAGFLARKQVLPESAEAAQRFAFETWVVKTRVEKKMKGKKVPGLGRLQFLFKLKFSFMSLFGFN